MVTKSDENKVVPLSESTHSFIEKIIKIQGETTGTTPSKRAVIDSVIEHLYKNAKA